MQLALCSHDTGPVVVAHSERILDTGIMSTAVGHRSAHYSEQSWNPAAVVAAAVFTTDVFTADVFTTDVFTADDEGPIDINRSEAEDSMLPLARTVA